jgi:hypothetical protein
MGTLFLCVHMSGELAVATRLGSTQAGAAAVLSSSPRREQGALVS